jgi:hypothetical protein
MSAGDLRGRKFRRRRDRRRRRRHRLLQQWQWRANRQGGFALPGADVARSRAPVARVERGQEGSRRQDPTAV